MYQVWIGKTKMIVTVECPLCARCISEHFTCFNAFKPCVSYCAFVTATQLVSLETLIWIPAVWPLSQLGFPGKWTVRWRLACGRFIRESFWDYHLWKVKKRRKQDWAEGEVELPFSLREGLSWPHRELWKWDGSSKWGEGASQAFISQHAPVIGSWVTWEGGVYDLKWGDSSAKSIPKRADNWTLPAAILQQLGNKSFTSEMGFLSWIIVPTTTPTSVVPSPLLPPGRVWG